MIKKIIIFSIISCLIWLGIISEVKSQNFVIDTIAGSGNSGSSGNGNIASTSTNTFNTPKGIWISTFGSIYIADRSNNQVRRISSSNQLSIFAGSSNGDDADGKCLF